MIEHTIETLDKLRWPIIKDVFLVFRPAATWDRIAFDRPGVFRALLVFLLPIIIPAALLEGTGLMLMGQREIAHGRNEGFGPLDVVVFEAAQWLSMFLILLLAALILMHLANTHHQRNRFGPCLVLVFEAMGPMLLVQWFNGFPGMYLWLTWFVGLALTVATLYHGLPRFLMVDPPTAMGLYFSTAVVITMLTFVVRFFTYWHLIGRIPALDHFCSGLEATPP